MIKNIVKVFPEAVVICTEIEGQETNELVTKVCLTNDSAKSNLFQNNETEDQLIKGNTLLEINSPINVKEIQNKENSDENQEILSLPKFIEKHQKLMEGSQNEIKTQIEARAASLEPENEERIEEDVHYFEVKTIRVKWENNQNAFMHVFVDITDAVNLEKEKTTNQGLHTMFQSVSHEFKTPINAFSNALDLLEGCFTNICDLRDFIVINDRKKKRKFEKSLELFPKYFKIGSVSVSILMRFIEDILDFAKIEAGAFSLNCALFKLEELFEDVKYIFLDQGMHKGIGLIMNCSPELLQTEFYSDGARIKQVLMNLISNSFKFTQRGSITIDIDLRNRVLPNFELKRFLFISVKDSGIGISKEDSKKLFKMFGMIDNSLMNLKGTGLGLTICKKLTELMGGEISLTSKENQGTTITFTVAENQLYPIEDHQDSLLEESKEEDSLSPALGKKLVKSGDQL